MAMLVGKQKRAKQQALPRWAQASML